MPLIEGPKPEDKSVDSFEKLLEAELTPEPSEPQQGDLFVVMNMASDWPIKDDVSTMEYPMFTLSKIPVKTIREYSRGGKVFRIIPSVLGAPNIFDKDLMIFLVSSIVKASNDKVQHSKRIRFNVTDFLKGTRRSTGGAAYVRVVDMCRRLAGCRIETNIRTTESEQIEGFGMLQDYKVTSYSNNKKGALEVEVVLSDWMYRAAQEFDILTLNPDYFSLTQALERRIYEIARKHCGDQPWWIISSKLLMEKAGSETTARKWRQELRDIEAQDNLPDYRLFLDDRVKKDEQVIFVSRDSKKVMEAAKKKEKVEWLQEVLQMRLREKKVS